MPGEKWLKLRNFIPFSAPPWIAKLVAERHFAERPLFDSAELVVSVADGHQGKSSHIIRKVERAFDLRLEDHMIRSKNGSQAQCATGENDILYGGINGGTCDPGSGALHARADSGRN